MKAVKVPCRLFPSPDATAEACSTVRSVLHVRHSFACSATWQYISPDIYQCRHCGRCVKGATTYQTCSSGAGRCGCKARGHTVFIRAAFNFFRRITVLQQRSKLHSGTGLCTDAEFALRHEQMQMGKATPGL